MDVLTKLWRRAAKSASIARAPAPPAQWLADSVVAGLLLAGFLSVFGARNARAQSDTRTSIESVKARFRFSADEAGVLVPVTLNDISRPFMIDTGASITAFDRSLRDWLRGPARAMPVKTANGVVSLDFFGAPRARLGKLQLGDVSEVCCVDLTSFRAGTGSEFYGFIGMDFLRGHVMRIDFDVGEVVMLRTVPNDSGEPLPLSLSSKRAPTVTVAVAGMGDLPFIIDTACLSSGTLESPILARLLHEGNATQVSTTLLDSVANSRAVRTVSVREIALGVFRHHGAVFDEGAKNLLGIGYLSRYVITFDFPRKKLYLKPSAGFAKPARYNLSGAQIWRANGATTIRFVEEGGPAELAGLNVGDIIDEIDGRSAGSFSMVKISRILCREGSHMFRVTRGKKIIDIGLVIKEPPNLWGR